MDIESRRLVAEGQAPLAMSSRLLEAMEATGVKTIVFSSSATVYGDPQYLPLTESHPLSASNPYGRSKIVIEDMLALVRAVYEAEYANMGALALASMQAVCRYLDIPLDPKLRGLE